MKIRNIFLKRNRVTPLLVAAFAPSILFGHDVYPQGKSVPCRTGPMVKNLMAPNTPPCSAPAPTSGQLTRKEVNKLMKTPTSRQDDLKLAQYHRAQADSLAAQSVAYEKAAASYQASPKAKNLTAPNTAARFNQMADSLRDRAKVEIASAVSNKQMAAVAPQDDRSVGGQ